jgi:hypothetical protein
MQNATAAEARRKRRVAATTARRAEWVRTETLVIFSST